MSKKWLVGLAAVSVLASNAFTAVFAQDNGVTYVNTEENGRVMIINDGRLNEFDVAAPVAVYNTYQTITNDDGTFQDVPNGIELLAIDPTTNEGYLVLSADLSELSSLISGATNSLQANGYSLNYSSGWFWVTAPADAEGKVYSFTWENQTFAAG